MSRKKEKVQKPPKRIARVFKEKAVEENHYILADRETGVHYLLIQHGDGSAITPLLDEKGKVVVCKVEKPDEGEPAMPASDAS